MNNTNFELVLAGENKDKFIEWMNEHGPHFYECESRMYFCEDETYAEYYAEHYADETTLFTSVPVCVESRLGNLICKAAEELSIGLKFIVFYQDPGTVESYGGWTIV